ncbi:MAG TPA: FIST N-terminal domain-containing protein [Thermoanaerobaculia bacterium]|nr:FIST N-terminal domain-containing protein [Thermoanaerobaculia bacterium]
MRSQTVHLAAGHCPPEDLRAACAEPGRDPDLVLAFLPPGDELAPAVAALAAAWPDSLRVGCEAVTQFADAEMTSRGSIQLFWFDDPDHLPAVEVIEASHQEVPAAERIARLAGSFADADGVLLLSDGLRFPAEFLLDGLRDCLVDGSGDAGNSARRFPPVAGGLASHREPTSKECRDRRPARSAATGDQRSRGRQAEPRPAELAGARVFCGDEIFPSACVAVVFHGVEMRVEVVRGWEPASPIYRVDRAEGNVIFEIDGQPATDWYRRFFIAGDQLVPLPESSYRFPLLLEGPSPERQGLYRSMRFFDEPAGAVTFWGGVQPGDLVRLGMGNGDSLVRTAAELPRGAAPEAAMLYSCVGREAVLGDRAGQEVAAIHGALGGISLSGFFTHGEIGPTPRGRLAFYNLTAVLVLLAEARS